MLGNVAHGLRLDGFFETFCTTDEVQELFELGLSMVCSRLIGDNPGIPKIEVDVV
jgi:hypothetical protein